MAYRRSTRFVFVFVCFLASIKLTFAEKMNLTTYEPTKIVRELTNAVNQDDFEKADWLIREMVDVDLSLLSVAERLECAKTLSRLGVFYLRKGRCRDAIFVCKLVETSAKDEPALLADIYETLFTAFRRLDDHAEAWKYVEKVWLLRRRAVPKDDPDLARALNDLARYSLERKNRLAYDFRFSEDQTLASVEDLTDCSYLQYSLNAEKMLERALEINAARFGDNSYQAAQVYRSLGLYYRSEYVSKQDLDAEEASLRKQENFDKSLEFYERARKTFGELLGAGSSEYVEVALELIDFFRETGDSKRIAELLDETIAAFENNPGNSLDGTRLYGECGRVLFDFAAELEDERENVAGEKLESYDELLQNLRENAARAYRRSLELAFEAANDFYGGDAELGKFLFDVQNDSAHSLVEYYFSLGDVNSCFETIEFIRSIGLRAAMNGLKTGVGNSSAETRRRVQAERLLNELEARFEALLKRRVAGQTTDSEYRSSLYDLNAEIVAARAKIREVAALTAARRPILDVGKEKVDFATICADLKKTKTLALEFAAFSEPIFDLFELNEVAAKDGNLYRSMATENYSSRASVYLIAFGSGLDAPKLLPLVISEEIAERCKCVAPEWRIEPGPLRVGKIERVLRNGRDGVLDDLAGTPNGKQPSAPQTDVKLNALWNILIPDEEVRNVLTRGDCERVLILPDGALWTLPFESLVVDPNLMERKYFLDVCPPVVYAPSIKVYRRLKEAARRDDGTISNVLTLGNPAYPPFDKTIAKLRLEATSLEQLRRVLIPLPGTERESSNVEALCREYGKRLTRLTGASATEKNLRASLSEVEIAHLATHGFVDDSNGNQFGALAMATGDGVSHEDDGFLTVSELEDLDLSKCRLCAMSACNVGGGSIQLGEGVYSLGRAAFCAGARRAMTTAWSLSDSSAAYCVSSFIENVFQTEASGALVDYSKALRDAKLATRRQKKWRDPFYWAPFELWGVE